MPGLSPPPRLPFLIAPVPPLPVLAMCRRIFARPVARGPVLTSVFAVRPLVMIRRWRLKMLVWTMLLLLWLLLLLLLLPIPSWRILRVRRHSLLVSRRR